MRRGSGVGRVAAQLGASRPTTSAPHRLAALCTCSNPRPPARAPPPSPGPAPRPPAPSPGRTNVLVVVRQVHVAEEGVGQLRGGGRAAGKVSACMHGSVKDGTHQLRGAGWEAVEAGRALVSACVQDLGALATPSSHCSYTSTGHTHEQAGRRLQEASRHPQRRPSWRSQRGAAPASGAGTRDAWVAPAGAVPASWADPGKCLGARSPPKHTHLEAAPEGQCAAASGASQRSPAGSSSAAPFKPASNSTPCHRGRATRDSPLLDPRAEQRLLGVHHQG